MIASSRNGSSSRTISPQKFEGRLRVVTQESFPFVNLNFRHVSKKSCLACVWTGVTNKRTFFIFFIFLSNFLSPERVFLFISRRCCNVLRPGPYSRTIERDYTRIRRERYLVIAGFHFVVVLVGTQEKMYRCTLYLKNGVKASHSHDCNRFRIIPFKKLV